jgi:nucleoside-diphosphate-sugar epimerase
MRIFLTGATGFVGSAIVQELIGEGHEVLGLERSDAESQELTAAGAKSHRGDLADVDSLRSGVAETDGVIHTAFNHDFSKFAASADVDRLAIEAMGETLVGSDRPFVVTSGLPHIPGRTSTEDDVPPAMGGMPRVSEQTAMALVARGVRASVVRMSQVHDRDRQGFATYLIAIARDKGVSAYVGDGQNRWPAVHRFDAAPLYRLALEKGQAGATYHAVTEEGVAVRAVAEAIGRGLGMPVVALSPNDAAAHFGDMAMAANMNAPASAIRTQDRLGWQPAGHPGFLDDLRNSTAFSA